MIQCIENVKSVIIMHPAIAKANEVYQRSKVKVCTAATSLAFSAAMMTINASAAEETTSSGVTSLVDVGGITSLLGSIWSFMTSNPLLSFFVGCSVIAGICGVFKKLRRTAH